MQQANERRRRSESDLDVIKEILTFRPCSKFSTMKMIHQRARKTFKEFVSELQKEPHVKFL